MAITSINVIDHDLHTDELSGIEYLVVVVDMDVDSSDITNRTKLVLSDLSKLSDLDRGEMELELLGALPVFNKLGNDCGIPTSLNAEINIKRFIASEDVFATEPEFLGSGEKAVLQSSMHQNFLNGVAATGGVLRQVKSYFPGPTKSDVFRNSRDNVFTRNRDTLWFGMLASEADRESQYLLTFRVWNLIKTISGKRTVWIREG